MYSLFQMLPKVGLFSQVGFTTASQIKLLRVHGCVIVLCTTYYDTMFNNVQQC